MKSSVVAVSKSNPSIRQFSELVTATQKTLLSDIYITTSHPDISYVAQKINELVSENLLADSHVYDSLDNLEETFEFLYGKLEKECEKKGIIEAQPVICESMRLILQFYHMNAKELFFPSSIEKILNGETDEELDGKQILQNKAQLLQQKVMEFNQLVKQQEEVSLAKKIEADDAQTELQKVFLPLLNEEMRSKEYILVPIILELEEQRNTLMREIRKFNYQANGAILEFKKRQETVSKRRMEMLGGKLSIDVIYLKNFRELHPAKIEKYINATQKHKYKKIQTVLNLVDDVVIKMEVHLKKMKQFREMTDGMVSGEPKKVAQDIANLLVKKFESFKSDSMAIYLNNTYPAQFEYLREGLPKIQIGLEQELMAIGKQYLEMSENQNWYQQKLLQKEYLENQAKELLEYQKQVQPYDYLSELKPIRLLELQIDTLNESWGKAFRAILKKEVDYVKQRFASLQNNRSDAAVKEVAQLRHHVWRKLDRITVFLLAQDSLRGRVDLIESILYKVCDQLSKGFIYKEMDEYLRQQQQGAPSPIPLPATVDLILAETDMENSLPEQPKGPTSSRAKRWFDPLINARWKRLLWGVAVSLVVSTMIILTWQFVAALSLLAYTVAAVSGLSFGTVSVAFQKYSIEKGSLNRDPLLAVDQEEAIRSGSYREMNQLFHHSSPKQALSQNKIASDSVLLATENPARLTRVKLTIPGDDHDNLSLAKRNFTR